MSDESFIFISTPINVGVGGFRRSYFTVPEIAKLMSKELGIKAVLYIPVNSILSIARLICQGKEKGGFLQCIEDSLYKFIEESISNIKAYVAIDKILLEDMINLASWILKRRSNSIMEKVKEKYLETGYIHIEKIKRLELYFLRKFLKSLDSGWIYITQEQFDHVFSGFTISKAIKASAACMLQSEPYIIPRFNFKDPVKSLVNLQINKAIRSLYLKFMRSRKLRVLMSVSSVPFLTSGIYKEAAKYGVALAVPKPANAFSRDILIYRKLRYKRPIAVYFGRLVPEKGIYDLLHIWKLVSDHVPRAELRIFGVFINLKHKIKFLKLVRELNINSDTISIKGYIPPSPRLWREISEARVLIYPSYRDTFSLVILEALALGLIVVAYNIPLIHSVYGQLPPIFKARPGDINGMARLVINVFEMTDDKLISLHENPITKRFLELHSSWKNVAQAEYRILRKRLLLSSSSARTS